MNSSSLLLLLLFWVLASCQDPEQEPIESRQIDLGHISGPEYRHEGLGLHFEVPRGWQVRDALQGKEFEPQVSAAVPHRVRLFEVLPYPLPVSSHPAPMLSLGLEEFPNTDSLPATEPYLNQIRQSLIKGDLPYEFVSTVSLTPHSGDSVYTFWVGLLNKEIYYRQVFFAFPRKQYMLLFVMMLPQNQAAGALGELLKEMEWEEANP